MLITNIICGLVKSVVFTFQFIVLKGRRERAASKKNTFAN